MSLGNLRKKSEIDYWVPEKIWCNQTAFIIGGGPSLLNFSITRLRGCNCIAVNNSYMIAPWAPYLFFHDRRWLDWHSEGVKNFQGTIVTTYSKPLKNGAKPIHQMRKDRKIAINCIDRGVLAGIDSGTMALNLAFHLGATTIALVGFDMGFMPADKCGQTEDELVRLQTPMFHPDYQMPKSRAIDTSVLKHWHPEHPIPPRAGNYVNFLAQYVNIVRALASQNVRLVSLTDTHINISKVKFRDL